jgi:hypothetical protein
MSHFSARRDCRAIEAARPVAGAFGFVAKNEFIFDEKSIFDRPKRSADPPILGRKKADYRDQQQTGIEPNRTLHQCCPRGRRAALICLDCWAIFFYFFVIAGGAI